MELRYHKVRFGSKILCNSRWSGTILVEFEVYNSTVQSMVKSIIFYISPF